LLRVAFAVSGIEEKLFLFRGFGRPLRRQTMRPEEE
jgi:hypothetical protein